MTLKTFKREKTNIKPFTQEQIKALINDGQTITTQPQPEKKAQPQSVPNKTSQHKKKTPSIQLMFELSKQEPTEDQIKMLAQELYEWGDNDEALTLARFYLQKGITGKTFMQWVKKYPILQYSYEMTLMAIGVRLHKLALIKDSGANLSFIMYILHRYHDEWREADKYHDQRKINIEKAKHNISNDDTPKDDNWL